MTQEIQKALQALKNPKQAQLLQKFFKTGKGEYGESDKFLGLTVPQQRIIAKQFKSTPLPQLTPLLKSPIHEDRQTALFILVLQFEKSTPEIQTAIYKFLLKNLNAVNNWDLIDINTPKIIGAYMLTHPQEKPKLTTWARSKNLWHRRIAVLATFAFINQKQFKEALEIAEILVNDSHDLIHKAVGWQLREIGKKDQATEEKFLARHHKTMPRTMLRYAIERFSASKRQFYMAK